MAGPEVNTNISENLAPFLHSGYAEIRALTAQTMGQHRVVSAQDSLMELIKDTNIEVALAAIQALGKIGKKSTISKLWRVYVEHPSGEVKLAVIQALGHIDASEVFNYLCRCIENPDKSARWSGGSDDYIYWLEVQYRALECMLRQVTRKSFSISEFYPEKHIVKIIVSAINNLDFQDLSAPGLTILAALGSSGIEAVSLFLKHPQAIIRRRAINVLKSSPGFSELIGRSLQCRSRFECLLEDTDSRVASSAASALAAIGWLARLKSIRIKDEKTWSSLPSSIQIALIQETAIRDNSFLQTILLKKISPSDIDLKIAAITQLKIISCPILFQYLSETITHSISHKQKDVIERNFVQQILNSFGRTTIPLRRLAVKNLCDIVQEEKLSVELRLTALKSLENISEFNENGVQSILNNMVLNHNCPDIELRSSSLVSLCHINPQRGAESVVSILENFQSKEILSHSTRFQSTKPIFTSTKTNHLFEHSDHSTLSTLLSYYEPNDILNSNGVRICTSSFLSHPEQKHLLNAEQRKKRNLSLVCPKSVPQDTVMVLTAINQILSIEESITSLTFRRRCELQLIALLNHSDTRIKIAVMEVLTKHISKKAIPSLLPLLADRSEQVRVHAARTLAKIDANHLLIYGDILLFTQSACLLQIVCDAIVEQQKTYFTSRLYQRLLELTDSSLRTPVVRTLLMLAGPVFFSHIIDIALTCSVESSITIAQLLKDSVPQIAIENLLSILENETLEKQYRIITMLAILGENTQAKEEKYDYSLSTNTYNNHSF